MKTANSSSAHQSKPADCPGDQPANRAEVERTVRARRISIAKVVTVVMLVAVAMSLVWILLIGRPPVTQAQAANAGSPPFANPYEVRSRPAENRLMMVMQIISESFQIRNVGQETLRQYRGWDAAGPVPLFSSFAGPGPTLRARLGDQVQISFQNKIDDSQFPYSFDTEPKPGLSSFGCDRSGTLDTATGTYLPYPANDIFPNCFHGSSTANIHFHGTHTSPDGLGDNVLVQVLPQLQQPDWTNTFNAIFNSRKIPQKWTEMPLDYQNAQAQMISQHDTEAAAAAAKNGLPKPESLSAKNQELIASGQWPQYIMGAFPNFFEIPDYDAVPGKYKAGQAPGTHWYHAHKHGSTAINVSNGMTGAFIIEGSYDDDLNAFYGPNWTRTQPLMVINQLGVTPNLLRGGQTGAGGIGATDKGPDFSINGQIHPVVNMRPNEVQMWRVVNTSGRAGVYFHTPPAAQYQWKQLAQDGVQFNDFNYQSRPHGDFLLAAGNRADLLVQAKPCPGGAKTCQYPVVVQNEVDPADLASANNLTLLTINVAGDPVPTTSPAGQFIPHAPRFPAFLKDISTEEITGTKIMTFSSTSPGKGGMHEIDGKKFDGEVGALVQLNKVEEWKIQNATYGPPISHPFHIHINPFQVTEIFDPNATMNVNYTDPRTKKTLTAKNVRQYAFVPGDLFTIAGNPGFEAYVRKQQCQLDPQAEPETWKPCGPPFKNENNIWWDVFPIPSGRRLSVTKTDPKTGQQVPVEVPGYFKMRSRFVDYAGYYVLHCHILAHEDRGMMTVVEVSPATTPYSHN